MKCALMAKRSRTTALRSHFLCAVLFELPFFFAWIFELFGCLNKYLRGPHRVDVCYIKTHIIWSTCRYLVYDCSSKVNSHYSAALVPVSISIQVKPKFGCLYVIRALNLLQPYLCDSGDKEWVTLTCPTISFLPELLPIPKLCVNHWAARDHIKVQVTKVFFFRSFFVLFLRSTV